MNALEQAARDYQDALAVSERARKVASLAQEKADRYIADADVAHDKAKRALDVLQDVAMRFGRDF